MSTAQEKSGQRHGRRGSNGVRRGGDAATSSRKRRYERTTPIGRALKNLAKVGKTLALVKDRLVSWGATVQVPHGSADVDLHRALGSVVAADVQVSDASAALVRLEESRFVPTRRSSVVTFKADDEVKISDKYKSKYLEVYPASVLDGLVVSKTLPTGEIAVEHGKVAFIVPKSHLGRRA